MALIVINPCIFCGRPSFGKVCDMHLVKPVDWVVPERDTLAAPCEDIKLCINRLMAEAKSRGLVCCEPDFSFYQSIYFTKRGSNTFGRVTRPEDTEKPHIFQLLSGVDYRASENILHRDEPQNMRTGSLTRTKSADFNFMYLSHYHVGKQSIGLSSLAIPPKFETEDYNHERPKPKMLYRDILDTIDVDLDTCDTKPTSLACCEPWFDRDTFAFAHATTPTLVVVHNNVLCSWMEIDKLDRFVKELEETVQSAPGNNYQLD